jgi:uncharacterized membrane protein (DUF4010 family)
MELIIVKEFVVAAILGFIIGLQRELSFFHNDKPIYMGARTLAIISLIGYLGTKLYKDYPAVLTISFVLVGLFLLAFYIINAYNDKLERGNTTEFSALIAFIMGVLVYDYLVFAIFATIILIAILEIKPKLISLKKEIKEKDSRATILFLLMTFVVLPILPNHTIDPYNLFNPRQIWMMVILISGLSFIGYIVTRFFSASKGLLVMGFFGGLASSTAVTLTLSKKASTNNETNTALVIAIAIASSTMFLRIILWTLLLNRELFEALLLPYIFATIIGYFFIYILYIQTKKKEISQEVAFHNPLEFHTALKMGILFGVIFSVLSLVDTYMGSLGVYLVSFLSGLSDVDAIVLSLGELFNETKLSKESVLYAIILATVANTFTKIVISLLVGNRFIALKLFTIFSLSLLGLLTSFYFLEIM